MQSVRRPSVQSILVIINSFRKKVRYRRYASPLVTAVHSVDAACDTRDSGIPRRKEQKP